MRTPKLLCAALLVVSFSLFSASQLRADDVSYVYTSGGNTFTFELPTNPATADPTNFTSGSGVFTITNVSFSENGGAQLPGIVDFLSSTSMLGGFGLLDTNTGNFVIDAFGVFGQAFMGPVPPPVPGQQLYSGPETGPTLLSGGPFPSFWDYANCDTLGINCDDPTQGGTDVPPAGTLISATSVPTPTPEPSSLLLLAVGLALGVVTTLLRKS